MKDFAHSTGLTSDEEPKRYLWTDAFAVCNYLGLHTATGEEPFRVLALELVDQVHRILGRHRPDDPREGWISGLSEAAGARHPTAGGLRIGKPAPERWPDERHNPRTEWDRDGQYYHYLTKWMHALSRVWQVTGDETYHGWAVELGEAAHRGFLVPGTGSKRLSWKMSIDLSRRLVPSTGLHDPLDGFLTLCTLETTAPAGSAAATGSLDRALRDLREMCHDRMWVTDDPLGAGGLLVDLYRCWLLRSADRLRDDGIFAALLNDALVSLKIMAALDVFQRPARLRLAFRELGLSIGLRAAERLVAAVREETWAPAAISEADLEALNRHRPLAEEIEKFWMDPAHRRAEGWSEHREISRVMLATSLVPNGFLGP
jgi:hypothetical protein